MCRDFSIIACLGTSVFFCTPCSDLEYGLEVFTFYSISWDFSIFLLIIIDVHRENTLDIFLIYFI
jgi:hypothetical protein